MGDRYVLEAMRAKGFNVGGEQSGHIILSDFTTTGDGLVAALQLLAVLKQQGRPVSEICQRFEQGAAAAAERASSSRASRSTTSWWCRSSPKAARGSAKAGGW